jgi:hypothetical protein
MPARKNPVANLSITRPDEPSGATNTVTFADAPAMEHQKNTQRGEYRSATARKTKTSVPMMNPSWTAEVI